MLLLSNTARLIFVPGKRPGQTQPVLDGHRVYKDSSSKNGNAYYRCCLYKSLHCQCPARITLDSTSSLISTPLSHSHDIQHDEISATTAKRNLKSKAETSDLSTKYLVADLLGGLSTGARTRLDCNIGSFSRIIQRSRAAALGHPINPTSQFIQLPHFLWQRTHAPLGLLTI